MICSLNEIEALSRKAARGAGMSWGLAEEAGKAVRWLSDNGFAGPWLLAELLRRNDGTPYADLVPRPSDGIWRARSGPLCPIIAGALICDRADELKAGAALRLQEVAVPLLLAPFAAAASRSAGVALALEWQGVSLLFGGGAPKLDGAAGATATAGPVTLSTREGQAPAGGPAAPDRHVTAETFQILESFAFRTYAPATEASRAGAGAGSERD
ncbi:DUF3726 domain-containing protein [Limimaricola cinnabarinus]|jgi:hypothetical protein|uniref:DUF3726 domain-containing protein n=1 Tax=Limimaricola cinnabarinus TaxID=1125964 RepID=A0A2G1MHS7_9RHOB|nr:DUF3726 domain-containing protein [Limimaricola cinnabarinus]PHP28212.1 hypothetical protein CJ301_07505 [Limimaricola cinnabarinus]